MRAIVFGLLSAGLLLPAPAPAPAQDTARALVVRAIKAHGGEEKLSQIRADRVKTRGTLNLGSRETHFTAETTVQFPSQFKNVMQIMVENRMVTLVQVLNGDQAYRTVDGQTQKVEPAALAEMRETLQLNQAVRLVPLLNDPAFTLELLPEARVQDRPALALRVSARGRKELRLYFDRETALLVKTEHKIGDKAGKELRQEELYSDFRDLGGYRRPVKVTAYREGTKVLDAEVTEVKYYAQIDDAEFGKP
jgi:hypothetical protein